MLLTLEEAARLLAKSRRQITYMIDQGKIQASKVNGRWQVDRESLSPYIGTPERALEQNRRLRAAVEDALEPATRAQAYSVMNLHAVKVATQIWRDLSDRNLDPNPPATLIRECLDYLAVGCHRYNREHKTNAYLCARDCASRAAIALLLSGDDVDLTICQRIEGELIPAMAGLLRRVERQRDSRRHNV